MLPSMIGPMLMSAGQKTAAKLGTKFATGMVGGVVSMTASSKMADKCTRELNSKIMEEEILLTDDDKINKEKRKAVVKTSAVSAAVGTVFTGICFGITKMIENA